VLAKSTNYIDLIIGGHTHTFLEKPDSVRNLKGKEVLINQVGFAGINLGRIDYVFERSGNKKISYFSEVEEVKSILKI
jgi:5'-nucleotidase